MANNILVEEVELMVEKVVGEGVVVVLPTFVQCEPQQKAEDPQEVVVAEEVLGVLSFGLLFA